MTNLVSMKTFTFKIYHEHERENQLQIKTFWGHWESDRDAFAFEIDFQVLVRRPFMTTISNLLLVQTFHIM